MDSRTVGPLKHSRCSSVELDVGCFFLGVRESLGGQDHRAIELSSTRGRSPLACSSRFVRESRREYLCIPFGRGTHAKAPEGPVSSSSSPVPTPVARPVSSRSRPWSWPG